MPGELGSVKECGAPSDIDSTPLWEFGVSGIQSVITTGSHYSAMTSMSAIAP